MSKFNAHGNERIQELPPPPPGGFLIWLDGFLTGRKTISEEELELLRNHLKKFSSPRFIIEERS